MADKSDRNETGNIENSLRETARKNLAKSPQVTSELEKKTPEEIIHELRVHQIELEDSSSKYRDLYDFAPVAYFTLNHKGIIEDVNLAGATLLGMPRPKLLGLDFGHFVAADSLGQFDIHISSVLKQKEKLSCNLGLKKEDGSSLYVRLESIGNVESTEEEGTSETRKVLTALIDITEFKRAEENLQNEKDRFRGIVNSMNDGVYIVNAAHDTEYINPSIEASLGTLTGRKCYDYFHNLTEPCPWCKNEEVFAGRSVHWEWLSHKTGKTYDLFDTPLRNPDGSISKLSFFHDISDRKKAEEHAKRLIAAVGHAAEGIIITDATGIIEYVNPAEETITGYSRDELIGQKPSIFKSDKHDNNFYSNLWETINAGNVWSGRFVNRKKDGTEYREDANISPVYDESGNLTNFVAVKHDVSKQLELQEQLFQAQKMEAIGTLAGGFAHDFNNKLQVINGYVDLILFNKDLPETVKSDLEALRQTVDSSAELIKGMMVFSRKTSVQRESLNLNSVVTRLGSVLVRIIPKNVRIDLVLADDTWLINGAPNQIDQILMNLSVNARDAMPDGGTLTIETQNTILDEASCHSHPNTKPGRYVRLSVTDTGDGMDEATVLRIFEPFFTTKDKDKGTGLGLAVVYGIVDVHGGMIICDSEPSVGTTFRIYFPAIEAVSEAQHSEKKKPPSGLGETILLVDDEPDLLDLVSRQLVRANYTVIRSSKGKDALELYGKHRAEIRLVILDLLMQGMSGKECLLALRELNPNVRVLIASGALKSEIEVDLAEIGAKGFIAKPFDTPQLFEKIRQIIDEE